MKLPIYDTKGKELKQIDLNQDIFELPWNADLVYQVFTSMESNSRQPIAHTKDRGEVRGGGKKPWKQKGTGRARHGSRRSPIWVGGGVTFGPRSEKNYSKKVNKKMKAKALAIVLSKKIKDGEVILVSDVNFAEPKTKEANGILKALSDIKGFEKLATKRKNAAMFALSKKDINTEKSFGNLKAITVDEIRNLNILDLLKNKYLIIENAEEGLKNLETRLVFKNSKDKVELNEK